MKKLLIPLIYFAAAIINTAVAVTYLKDGTSPSMVTVYLSLSVACMCLGIIFYVKK